MADVLHVSPGWICGCPLLKHYAGQASHEIANPVYYIFFVNNFDYIRSWPAFPDALILIILWSVAVEEQFYLVWPVVIKFFNEKKFPIFFSLVILGNLVFRSFHVADSESDYAVRQFHTLAVIGDMALGGLMAYFCSYPSRFYKYIVRLKKIEILFIYAGAIVILLFRDQIFFSPVMWVFERLIIAAFFGFIILEQNYARYSFFKFSNFKLMSKLGILSYGLYCLHFFIISIIQNGANKLNMDMANAWNVLFLTGLGLALSIITCFFSYKYFERPFLVLKDRFAFIRKDGVVQKKQKTVTSCTTGTS